MVTLWANLKNINVHVKTDVATFKTNFEKIGLLFITTSGQTDSKAKQATTILK